MAWRLRSPVRTAFEAHRHEQLPLIYYPRRFLTSCAPHCAKSVTQVGCAIGLLDETARVYGAPRRTRRRIGRRRAGTSAPRLSPGIGGRPNATRAFNPATVADTVTP